MSGYGLQRFLMPICPHALAYGAPLMLCLSLISLIYASLITLRQIDLKKLIAFSSIAHMALVLASSACISPDAFIGALILMITHGMSSGALFLLIGALYEQHRTRLIRYLANLQQNKPLAAGCLLLATLLNLSLPGTGSYIAELLILVSVAQISLEAAIGLSSTVILGGLYSL